MNNVIILARGGSKGLPNKNILDIAGKPLIAWSIEQSLDSELVSNVYVSSDSDDILDVASKYGAIPIKRPDDLSTDVSSSESALKHALTIMDETKLVVFLQPTSPLRHSYDITNSINKLKEHECDSLFSCVILEDFCLWAKKHNIFY